MVGSRSSLFRLDSKRANQSLLRAHALDIGAELCGAPLTAAVAAPPGSGRDGPFLRRGPGLSRAPGEDMRVVEGSGAGMRAVEGSGGGSGTADASLDPTRPEGCRRGRGRRGALSGV
jgi:hypothetical protein